MPLFETRNVVFQPDGSEGETMCWSTVLRLGLVVLLLGPGTNRGASIMDRSWLPFKSGEHFSHNIVRKTIYVIPCRCPKEYVWNEKVGKCTRAISYSKKDQEEFNYQSTLARYNVSTIPTMKDIGPFRLNIPILFQRTHKNEAT